VKQLVLDLIPTPLPTFANFVEGRNMEARNALSDAAFQASAVKVLYLWGVSGSGKTHLAQAFLAARGGDAATTRAELLSTASLEAIATHREDIRRNGAYVIDGVDRLTNHDHAQVALFNIINTIQPEAGGVLVAFGDVAPRDLALRPELSSRLGSGLVFQLEPLSDDEKSLALNAHADARGFRLPEEVIAYLLRHSRRDMASLMSMLDALDDYAMQEGREITLPLLRTLMQERAQPSLL
jgi:DnaA-homolog protein